MHNYRAVIFDFGGVFTTSPVEQFAAYERQHGLPKRFIGEVIKHNHHHNAWARFERAEITRSEFDQAFAQETAAAGHEIRGDRLISLLVLSLKPVMAAALSRVKDAGLATGCITNNLPDLSSTDMVDKHESAAELEAIFNQFDHVIESSRVGVRKPEPKIYQMMCEALDVPAEQCIFLDDLGINLKPARDLGMYTIKVPFGDVQPAIDELFAALQLNT